MLDYLVSYIPYACNHAALIIRKTIMHSVNCTVLYCTVLTARYRKLQHVHVHVHQPKHALVRPYTFALFHSIHQIMRRPHKCVTLLSLLCHCTKAIFHYPQMRDQKMQKTPISFHSYVRVSSFLFHRHIIRYLACESWSSDRGHRSRSWEGVRESHWRRCWHGAIREDCPHRRPGDQTHSHASRTETAALAVVESRGQAGCDGPEAAPDRRYCSFH